MPDHTHDHTSDNSSPAEFTEEQLLRIWGKTDRSEIGDPKQYHPALFHLLDIGHVMLFIWSEVLLPVQRERIAKALGLGVAEAEIVVVLLAALHDLGKAAPAFQLKSELHAAAVRSANLPIEKYGSAQPLHSFISANVLPDLLRSGRTGWISEGLTAVTLAAITGAHHGAFPTAIDLKNIFPDHLGNDQWTAARLQIADLLVRHLFSFARPSEVIRTISAIEDAGLVPLLAGLISVADWIGSSQDYFPLAARLDQPVISISEYAEQSRQQAKAALEGFGWLPRIKFAKKAAFDAIYPFKPNELQKAVIRERDRAVQFEGPFLMVLEAAMGGGKTEAGDYIADCELADGRANGIFKGMPTQATGNAMFERFLYDTLQVARDKRGGSKAYISRRGHEGNLNLQLLHGNALLSEEFGKLRWATTLNGSNKDAVESRVTAEGWFTGRKRALLAPFGIGTIDQSLLGVLQTNHWFVRLMGLAGKVVIFDEVHSYDVYMSELLKRLIQWLSELDCTIILLSATLPQKKRHELIEAYRAGATNDLPEVTPSYPRVTCVSKQDGGANEVTVPSEIGEKRKRFRISFAPTAPETLPALVVAQMPRGGCGAILCNTVGRAQAVFETLRKAAENGEMLGWTPDQIHLFHARTPFCWRQAREAWAVAAFGKNAGADGKPERPKRAILVATSVVEQSLDLNFDWMASDLAPVDLLLQRLGREHRHDKVNGKPLIRPRGVRHPRFVILCDVALDRALPPGFAEGSVYIYEQYMLLLSFLALRDRTRLTLPADIEALVTTVYGPEKPEQIEGFEEQSETWRQELQKNWEEMNNRQENFKSEAEQRIIPEPKKPRFLMRGLEVDLFDDDDPKTHPSARAATRLGRPTITVVCTGDDEDGNRLAPSLTSEPDFKQTQNLLRWSVSISNSILFKALVKQPVPAGWKNNSHIRFFRELPFDRGCVTIEGQKLRLNAREGLIFVKNDASTEPNEDDS